MNVDSSTLLEGIPQLSDTDAEGGQVSENAPPPLEEGQQQDLLDMRAQQAQELEDPRVLGQMFNLTHNEVGNQGPEARQAFMETLFNRATARGQSLEQAINDRRYYPRVSYRPASLGPETINDYTNTLTNVTGGSNLSRYATGNASGRVSFNGGPHTYAAGGERFGIEGPDLGWHPNATAQRQSAGVASMFTGKDPSQITADDINAVIQGVPQRGLLAGDQPTAASLESAQQIAQSGGDTTSDDEGPSPQGNGIIAADIPTPDTSQMRVTGKRPDGTFELDNGQVLFNPKTGFMQWEIGAEGGTKRTFIKSGPYAKPFSFDSTKYHTNLADGKVYDLNKRDADGNALEVPLKNAMPRIDQSIMSKIVDVGGPVTNPDGSPFQNNTQAMQALQEYQQSQGVPTKYQQHVIDMAENTIKSGRNPYLRAFLQQAPNYASAIENINKPNRNGIDDALLIASYYGIERPGYAPTELDFKNYVAGQGWLGQMELKSTRGKALLQAAWDVYNGKEPSSDEAVTLRQGRTIPDEILPQMKQGLQNAIRPRWQLYDAEMETLRAQLKQSRIRNPQIYLPSVAPDFIRDEQAVKAAQGGAPAAVGDSPASAPEVSHGAAYDSAMRLRNSPDPKLRALAEAALEKYKREAQSSPTPSPSPTQ